ncbi:MAG TPA: ATPase, T2SS/T4P/T4SS family [Candidatus Hydrogenedentes bacterium]|nr:ATPase, T2SS/T4P/T4SS family [Candidatus Hydrogenedentota bacterium]HOV75712.1 ATPase, T2SS/T4P/T4SS family [Candidatus Hydrogenedentota bacterium]
MSTEEKVARAGEELVKRDVITREELVEAREREAATGTPWYRQLLQMRKTSFGMLEEIFLREFHPKSVREEHSRLGDTLVAMKIISQEQLAEALSEQNRNGRLLGNILLEKGTVTRETITRALAKQSGLEYAELAATPSDPEALECVPENMARRNSMLPVRLEGDKLTVLIPHPQTRDALASVGVLLGKRIYPILTSSDDLRAEITKRYHEAKLRIGRPHQPAPAAGQEIKPKETLSKEAKTMETLKTSDKARFEEIAREASGVPVIKLVTTIIEGAVNSGATDVHLDPQEPEMRVRYRIDGVLHDVMSIPADVQNAVVSRIKIMSDMDITETRHPQDGHISMEIADSEYDIRVATLPTYLGERVVLRLLDQSAVLAGIKDLGLDSEDERKLTALIKQPYGMILVTGPTGSGKTTTLYAALNQKNVMTDSIVTLEDPVEYQLSGINQVQIDADIDLTFANTLRAALRQDIDVLLVGEIRDPDTARIAIRAAMTGHLVFSTLHTNDAPEAISTLRNMGIPSYLIASALTAVVGQRLVRKICPNCKESFTPPKTLLKEIGLPESTKKLYRGKGCEMCYHTGSKGRTGIFEILEVTPEIRKLINLDKSVEEIAKTAKMKTMADRCRIKVKNGIVAPEEFLRTIRV